MRHVSSPRIRVRSQVIAELHRYGLRQLSAAMNEGDKQISRICLGLKLLLMMLDNIHAHVVGEVHHEGEAVRETVTETAEIGATGGQDQSGKAEGDLNPPTPSQPEGHTGAHLQAQPSSGINAEQLGAILTVR